MQIQEVKNIMSDIKNSLDGLNHRLEMTEESQWTWRQSNKKFYNLKDGEKNNSVGGAQNLRDL